MPVNYTYESLSSTHSHLMRVLPKPFFTENQAFLPTPQFLIMTQSINEAQLFWMQEQFNLFHTSPASSLKTKMRQLFTFSKNDPFHEQRRSLRIRIAFPLTYVYLFASTPEQERGSDAYLNEFFSSMEQFFQEVHMDDNPRAVLEAYLPPLRAAITMGYVPFLKMMHAKGLLIPVLQCSDIVLTTLINLESPEMLHCLLSFCPDEIRAQLCHHLHSLIHIAAEKSNRVMFDAFMEVLNKPKREIISANQHRVLRSAISNSNANLFNYLIQQFSPEEQHHIMRRYTHYAHHEMYHEAQLKKAYSVQQWMLSFPTILELVERTEPFSKPIQHFVSDYIQTHRVRPQHSSTPTEDEIKTYLCVVRSQIRKNTEQHQANLRFLLSIPGLRETLHEPLVEEHNELLYLAQILKNHNAVKWLLDIQNVQERNLSSPVNLSLMPRQNQRLAAIRARYQPLFTQHGVPVLWSQLISFLKWFCAYSEASIMAKDPLTGSYEPLAIDVDFERYCLVKQINPDTIRGKYNSHPLYACYRFLTDPQWENPELAQHKELLILLWLAVFDVKKAIETEKTDLRSAFFYKIATFARRYNQIEDNEGQMKDDRQVDKPDYKFSPGWILSFFEVIDNPQLAPLRIIDLEKLLEIEIHNHLMKNLYPLEIDNLPFQRQYQQSLAKYQCYQQNPELLCDYSDERLLFNRFQFDSQFELRVRNNLRTYFGESALMPEIQAYLSREFERNVAPPSNALMYFANKVNSHGILRNAATSDERQLFQMSEWTFREQESVNVVPRPREPLFTLFKILPLAYYHSTLPRLPEPEPSLPPSLPPQAHSALLNLLGGLFIGPSAGYFGNALPPPRAQQPRPLEDDLSEESHSNHHSDDENEGSRPR